jgi:hypothetical protein
MENFISLFNIIHPRPHIEILIFMAKKLNNNDLPLDKLALLDLLKSISTKTDSSLTNIQTLFHPINTEIIKTHLLIQQSQLSNSIIYQIILKLPMPTKALNRLLKLYSQISEQHICYCDKIRTEINRDYSNSLFSSESKILDLLTLDLSQLINIHNDLFRTDSNLYKIVHTHLNTHDFYGQTLIETILFYSEEEREIVLEYFTIMNDVNDHIKMLIASKCDFQKLFQFSTEYLVWFFQFMKIMADDNITNKQVKMIQLLQTTLEIPTIYQFLDRVDYADRDSIIKALYYLLKEELSNRLNDFYLNLKTQ